MSDKLTYDSFPCYKHTMNKSSKIKIASKKPHTVGWMKVKRVMYVRRVSISGFFIKIHSVAFISNQLDTTTDTLHSFPDSALSLLC